MMAIPTFDLRIFKQIRENSEVEGIISYQHTIENN